MLDIEGIYVTQLEVSLRTVSSIWHINADGLPRIQARQLCAVIRRDTKCVMVTLLNSGRPCGFFELNHIGCVRLFDMSESCGVMVFRGDRATFTVPAEEILRVIEETSHDFVGSSIATRFDTEAQCAPTTAELIPEFSFS